MIKSDDYGRPVTGETIAAKQHGRPRARSLELQQQLNETHRQQERLLNLHLSGNSGEAAFGARNTELRDRTGTLTLELDGADRQTAKRVDIALKVIELSQSLPSDAFRRIAPRIGESSKWSV